MIQNKELHQKWIKEHPESVKKYNHTYYKKHKQEILDYFKKIDRIPKRMFSNYSRHATYRQIAFDLSLADFCCLISSPCFYCGDLQEKFNGIDRIDSNLGYEINNCVSCCKICNYMKLNNSKENFIKKCRDITEKQGVIS